MGEAKPNKTPDATGRVPFWQSIQVKYAMIYLLVVATVVVLLNTYPVLMAQDMVFRSKETSLQSQASVVASTLAASEVLTGSGGEAEEAGTTITERIQAVMPTLEDLAVSRVLVTDASALIVYDSSEVEPGVSRYALLAEVVSALQGNDVFRSEYQENAFRSRAAVPIMYRGVTVGAVYLYEYDADQASLLRNIQANLRYVSVIICLVAITLCLVFSRSLSHGIGNLLRAIRKVREGEYNHRVEIEGGDELAQLAGEFNQLTDRLQTTEEVRRRFVSDASHELKTPLASIRLMADSILQNENMDLETIKDFVGDIGEEADRLTRISEKLLTLTRLDAGTVVEHKAVDVGRVIVRVQRMLQPLADAVEVTLQTDLRADCYVPASDDEVYQIAFNLMENAVKYNLPGGRVMVSLTRSEYTVTLEVADTGVGIPEEDRDKIFDRFYRVDKARSRAAGGTGLGLSIVSDTVRLFDGTIAVMPREGGGTRFIVTFPAYREQEVEV